MKKNYLLSTFFLSLIFALGLSAQGNVITIEEFVDLQKNTDNLVIIDASKPSLYNKAHMKGAINIPYEELNEPETDDNIFGMLLPVERLSAYLGEKGVSEKDMIVVYDEGTQKYSTRVFWTLKYLGVPNVKLLHKENTQWRKKRIKLTSSSTKLEAKTFTANLQPKLVTNLDFMETLKVTPQIVVLDTRSEKEFVGADPEKSLGHLPDAIHLFYKDVLKEDKSYLDKADLVALADKYNFTKDKKYILYCNSGIKATVVYVAFTEYLGFSDVVIYDGGYYEWEAYEMPMVK